MKHIYVVYKKKMTFMFQIFDTSAKKRPDSIMNRVGNRPGRPTGAYGLAYIGSGQAGLFI
jgi:hypothetical protein